jgi:hypothetical protein
MAQDLAYPYPRLTIMGRFMDRCMHYHGAVVTNPRHGGMRSWSPREQRNVSYAIRRRPTGETFYHPGQQASSSR